MSSTKMGEIKIAPNYSIVINGKKYTQGEIVKVADTSKYEGKKYAIIIKKSEVAIKEEEELEEVEDTANKDEEIEEKPKRNGNTKKGSKTE